MLSKICTINSNFDIKRYYHNTCVFSKQLFYVIKSCSYSNYVNQVLHEIMIHDAFGGNGAKLSIDSSYMFLVIL